MSAAAQFFKHYAGVHLGDPAAGNNVGLVPYLHDEEENVQAFHVPDLVRKVRDVRNEVRNGMTVITTCTPLIS